MVRQSLSTLLLAALLLTGCGAQPTTSPQNMVPPTESGATIPPKPVTENPATNSNDVFCTEEYAPVCAKRQVQCITTPCDPVEQTYPNLCYAQKDGAFDVKDGACTFE